MKARIDNLLDKVRESEHQEGAFSFLPVIIQFLETMREDTEARSEHRASLASGLERLVLEDWVFSESFLGGELLDLAGDFREF